MSDPAYGLQVAIYDALRADATVDSFVNGRVYDRVPPDPIFPYLVISDDQMIDDGNTCCDASESFVDIHIWHRSEQISANVKAAAHAKQIGAAVREVLATELAVAGHVNTSGTFEVGRNMIDPDGITSHRIMTFRYLLQSET